MSKQKGFTLAEMLITLMVIGSLMAFTIPAVCKYLGDVKYKTSYKRAYSNITSIIMTEVFSGRIDKKATSSSVAKLFKTLSDNLTVKAYSQQNANSDSGINNGIIYNIDEFKTSVKYKNESGHVDTVGDGVSIIESVTDWTETPSPWIVTEDNMAYSITAKSNDECLTKEELNAFNGSDIVNYLANNSCAIVIVDVNGLTKGPNKLEEQVETGINESQMETLRGDRYYIYIGSNGVAPGPKLSTVSGRLIAELK